MASAVRSLRGLLFRQDRTMQDCLEFPRALPARFHESPPTDLAPAASKALEANAAKYLAAEAGLSACQQAVRVHGGMGYAKEYHVERYLREIMISVVAPVSQEMIKSFVAEKALFQTKSY